MMGAGICDLTHIGDDNCEITHMSADNRELTHIGGEMTGAIWTVLVSLYVDREENWRRGRAL